jgi:hypothetical protein
VAHHPSVPQEGSPAEVCRSALRSNRGQRILRHARVEGPCQPNFDPENGDLSQENVSYYDVFRAGSDRSNSPVPPLPYRAMER